MIKKILDRMSNIMMMVSILSVVALIAVNAYEIFLRMFFNVSNYWIQDVTMLLMVWFVFPGMIKVSWLKRDIMVDILTARLHGTVKKITSIFACVIMVIFGVGMTISSVNYLEKVKENKTITAGIPQSLFTGMMVLGFFLLTCIYLYNLYEAISMRTEAKK